MKIAFEQVRFDERGLVPVVVQEEHTREVLTLAYMNAESLRKTAETGETWFWSRSRASLWHKGETSGNIQRVRDVRADCDGDALVVTVETEGPACHTGARSCFHKPLAAGEREGTPQQRPREFGETVRQLHALVETRRAQRPEGSYTTYLFDQGLDKILKKVGEESSETIIAAKNEDRAAFVGETADLIYHLIVLLVERGVGLDEVSGELSARAESKRRRA